MLASFFFFFFFLVKDESHAFVHTILRSLPAKKLQTQHISPQHDPCHVTHSSHSHSDNFCSVVLYAIPPLPSWNKIEKSLQPTYEYEPKPVYVDSALADSPSSSSSSYSSSNTKPTLFRERHGWCPYSERVWLALELKNIQYDTVLIDNTGHGRRPSYFSGQTPQIKWEDGTIQSESMDLVYAIDQKYTTNSITLYPKDIEDDVNRKIRSFRNIFPKQSRPSSRAAFLFRYDGEALWKSEFEKVLVDTNNLLKETDGPFFCGKSFTAADIAWIPFLERYRAQLPCLHDNLNVLSYPSLARWYEYIEEHVPEYTCRVKGNASSWRKVLTMAGYGNAGDIPSIVKSRMDDVSEQESYTDEEGKKREQAIWDRYIVNRPWIMETPAKEVGAIIARNRKAIIADMLQRNWSKDGIIDGNDDGERESDSALRALVCTILALDDDTNMYEDFKIDGSNNDYHRHGNMVQAVSSFLDDRMCVPRDMGCLCADVIKRLANI